MPETTEAQARGIAIWLATGRVGASSRAMAAHFVGQPCDGSYPHDADDFGRCEGLLDAVPGLRERVGEMASVNAYWAALAPAWPAIAAARPEARTAMIRALVRPIEDADPRVVRLGPGVTMRFPA